MDWKANAFVELYLLLQILPLPFLNSNDITVTYIHFQKDGTACQVGPKLCRKYRQQYSSFLDKASKSERNWINKTAQ